MVAKNPCEGSKENCNAQMAVGIRGPLGTIAYDNFGCPPYWAIVPAALADLVWLWFAIAAVGHVVLFGYLLFEAHRLAPKRLV